MRSAIYRFIALTAFIFISGGLVTSAQAQKKPAHKKPVHKTQHKKGGVSRAAKPRVVHGAAPYWAKPGTQLIYDVRHNGKAYRFVMTLRAINNGYNFDFEMTPPANVKGTVVITKPMADSAGKIVNFFGNGVTKLNEETAIWLSKRMFSEIKTKGSTEVTIDGSFDNLRLDDEGADVVPLYRGKSMALDQLQLRGELNDLHMSVLNNSGMPLILSMEGEFSIILKEIK